MFISSTYKFIAVAEAKFKSCKYNKNNVTSIYRIISTLKAKLSK